MSVLVFRARSTTIENKKEEFDYVKKTKVNICVWYVIPKEGQKIESIWTKSVIGLPPDWTLDALSRKKCSVNPWPPPRPTFFHACHGTLQTVWSVSSRKTWKMWMRTKARCRTVSLRWKRLMKQNCPKPPTTWSGYATTRVIATSLSWWSTWRLWQTISGKLMAT